MTDNVNGRSNRTLEELENGLDPVTFNRWLDYEFFRLASTIPLSDDLTDIDKNGDTE